VASPDFIPQRGLRGARIERLSSRTFWTLLGGGFPLEYPRNSKRMPLGNTPHTGSDTRSLPDGRLEYRAGEYFEIRRLGVCR